MTPRILLLVACSFVLHASAAAPPDYETLKAGAEKLYADGSYGRAHDLYAQAMELSNISSNETRWIIFRLGDTQWRSQAATQTADSTKLDEARRQLEIMIRDITRAEDRDRIWVEVQESLGDFHWTRRNQQNWGAAWPYYQQALEWWAGARDIELARQRYLALVWRMVRPPGAEGRYDSGYWGNYLPLTVLENVLKIAPGTNDQARAHYLIAMTIRNQGGQWEQRARVPEEFEAALKPGKSTDWYDDALFNYAEWMMGQGRAIPLENGNWRAEPDYAKALELFRRLATEFQKGETRYWDQAQQRIKDITDPQLGVSVPNIFLPDSEIQYFLNWRNVKQIELALYPVELNRDVKFEPGDGGFRHDWLQSIDLAGREKVKSWTHTPTRSAAVSAAASRNAERAAAEDSRAPDYRPGNATLRLDQKLKPGAYILEARGGGKDARELVLVTDATLVLKTSGRQTLVYFCSALDGSPLSGAKIALLERWQNTGGEWQTSTQQLTTDDHGIAVFKAPQMWFGFQLFAAGIRGDRQAFTTENGFQSNADRDGDWRIYAFTDRPAYRPKETVNWKFIARSYDGSVYATPSGKTVEFEIIDPRGTKVKADKAKLNAFGSAWGSLELTEQMPLGEYRVTFWNEGRKDQIGDATLFRLEEYKLPEFKVSVTTPEEDGHKKAFRVGETVEVTIQADYYFGGPVANASVEVLVHQNPYWHWWHEPRPFPWFYEDIDASPQGRGWHGEGQVVKRETLKTDAAGRATLTFDTPANSGQDFEYRIEARVTDSSRREITGSGNVRVTRQRYYVQAQAGHNLYRPQDKVQVNFKALDANEQPVRTEGTVKVTRDYWFEIWLAPDGREVKGDDLKRLQAETRIWPPPPQRPDQKDWRLKFRGYEHDDILTRSLATDTNGEAQLTFTPGRDGYYRVAWTSDDALSNLKSQISNPVRADTTVWVCTGQTTDLGYRHGGVEIIADKDTFRAGQTAPVMLVANAPGRHVLFSVEGEDLYSYQLVHLEGTVKLVELPVEEKHVPNVFLNAALVSDRQMFVDTKQIIVPPTKNFLTIDVKPDRPQYQPRDEGTLTITTRDDGGKPVPAEVSLGLVDESVFYIQGDYAGDPRQFYFGEKRAHRVQMQSTMNQKQYARLVPWENEGLIDERDEERMSLQQRLQTTEDVRQYTWGFSRSGFGGGGGGGAFASAPQPEADSFEMNAPAFGLAGAGFMDRGRDRMVPASPMVAKGMMALGRIPTGPAESPAEPAVVVRSDFRSTVFWQPDVVTDKNGRAMVKVKYPDSTTGWKATARAATAANQFGMADAATRTKQPLIVRLQAPRFFVVGDKVTISAVVNNNTDQPMEVKVALDVAGGLEISNEGRDAALRRPVGAARRPNPDTTLSVPANGEARADWIAEVKSPGEVKLKITGRAAKHSDAMEKIFVTHEHGIEKFISKSGKARTGDFTIKLDLPKERKPGSTSLTVQLTPSLAVTMLDALPYLIDYPYGCTEQTMSRFLPAAITAKTLGDLGLQPEDVMGRVFGGIETNTAAATHPKGKQDLAKLNDMVKASLERLYDFQHGDGGWGWWKEGESDHWMTAYVVWGLSLARDAKIAVKEDVLSRAKDFLSKELVEEEENPDMQAFMLHALGAYYAPFRDQIMSTSIPKALDNLWNRRDQLNAYTRALLALAAHQLHQPDRARTLIENLGNGVKRDDRPDTSVLTKPDTSHLTPDPSLQSTAHWGEDGLYWRWSDGGVEATAFALRALLAIDPTNRLVEPVANWLIKNRRGAQWSNTRDTAIVILAMNDYLRASGELKTDVEYELTVNGASIAKRKISAADVFNAPSRFAVEPKLIKDSNEIRIRQTRGDGPLYFAAEAKFFSLEEPVTAAGNEIFVKREYFKLVGRPTLLKGYVYDKALLRDGEQVKSGERVETVLTIEAKNNYEYLVFEDLKPAGLEAAEVRSGESLYARELKSGAVARRFGTTGSPVASTAAEYIVRSGDTLTAIARANQVSVQANMSANQLDSDLIRVGARLLIPPSPRPAAEDDFTGRSRWVYQELRDRKVALFVDKLPEGVWEIRYDLRAEVPGEFHALPVLGHAMYVPEIRCNGAEIRIRVEDAP